jgi:hypothetical protein
MRYVIQMTVEFTPLPREQLFAYWTGFKALMELLREEYRGGNRDHDMDCDPFVTKVATELRPGVRNGENTG